MYTNGKILQNKVNLMAEICTEDSVDSVQRMGHVLVG